MFFDNYELYANTLSKKIDSDLPYFSDENIFSLNEVSNSYYNFNISVSNAAEFCNFLESNEYIEFKDHFKDTPRRHKTFYLSSVDLNDNILNINVSKIVPPSNTCFGSSLLLDNIPDIISEMNYEFFNIKFNYNGSLISNIDSVNFFCRFESFVNICYQYYYENPTKIKSFYKKTVDCTYNFLVKDFLEEKDNELYDLINHLRQYIFHLISPKTVTKNIKVKQNEYFHSKPHQVYPTEYYLVRNIFYENNEIRSFFSIVLSRKFFRTENEIKEFDISSKSGLYRESISKYINKVIVPGTSKLHYDDSGLVFSFEDRKNFDGYIMHLDLNLSEFISRLKAYNNYQYTMNEIIEKNKKYIKSPKK